MTSEVRDADRIVTVCSACKRACCWQGIFYCDEYKTAGTIDMRVGDLAGLDLEHPSYWQPESWKP
jgi:hypothetical protein